jgi:hypothetical protein
MSLHGRPRAGKIPAAARYSGISKSSLYKLRAKYPALFRKNGAATLIDFDVLDRVIDELPAARGFHKIPSIKANNKEII